MNLSHYCRLADLFDFPSEGFPGRVVAVRDALLENYSAAAKCVDEFLALLPVESLNMMQELHTRTFDVQAVAALDIGYTMFGDDYKRGELLANLTREHRNHGNSCRDELADSLPNMLRLLPLLEDKELVEELVTELIAPALALMIQEFNPARLEKKNHYYKKHYKTLIETPVREATLYVNTLLALDAVLKSDFNIVRVRLPEKAADFLRALEIENDIEEQAKN